MTRIEYLLIQLASEANEVAHRASKCLHFGMTEIQPDQPLNNVQRLHQEFTDLLAVYEMLFEEGVIPDVKPQVRYMIAKQEKVRQYMQYSQELGICQP